VTRRWQLRTSCNVARLVVVRKVIWSLAQNWGKTWNLVYFMVETVQTTKNDEGGIDGVTVRYGQWKADTLYMTPWEGGRMIELEIKATVECNCKNYTVGRRHPRALGQEQVSTILEMTREFEQTCRRLNTWEVDKDPGRLRSAMFWIKLMALLKPDMTGASEFIDFWAISDPQMSSKDPYSVILHAIKP